MLQNCSAALPNPARCLCVSRSPHSIVLVNLCNVLAVLWSAQAGRKLAFYVIDVAIATDPVQAAITTTIRLIIVLVFGIVAVGCGYALYTLYLSSPVFLCEFGQPVFLGVHIHGLTEVFAPHFRRLSAVFSMQTPLVSWHVQVRSQMWKAYDKYFRGLVTELQPNLPSLSRQSTGDILANSTSSLQSVNPSSTSGHVSFISVLKDVLGMYVSLRNMFAAQDRLTIAAKYVWTLMYDAPFLWVSHCIWGCGPGFRCKWRTQKPSDR